MIKVYVLTWTLFAGLVTHGLQEKSFRRLPQNDFMPAMAQSIVDCYEIKIETPLHLVAESATWSQYKHANTA